MRLEEIQRETTAMIMHTPTGERRNQLTDANIHLMAAIDKFKGCPPL